MAYLKEKSNDDQQSNLEDFFSADPEKSESVKVEDNPSSPSERKESAAPRQSTSSSKSTRSWSTEVPTNDDEAEVVDEEEEVFAIPKAGLRESPKNLPPSYLLSVDYAGPLKKAIVRLYEPISKKIYFWYDNTGHLPYCYSELPPQTIDYKLAGHRGLVRTETVELKDLLRDQPRTMTKVIAEDPLSIGGGRDAIRDRLSERIGPDEIVSHTWEAKIRYRNCYAYDQKIVPGLIYKIENGNLVECPPDLNTKTLNEFKSIIQEEDDGLERIIQEYAPMFFTEVPDIRRLAVDIEVFSPEKNRIPDANTASEIVTAIGLSDNEGFNKCFILKRPGHKTGEKGPDFPKELDIVYYEDEKEMLIQAFRIIDKYPVVLTFVGDVFDLNYLYHRAKRLGVNLDQHCPIYLGRDIALLGGGIHVDLYRFLKNPSIRLYAMSGAYERNNLESIAQGLLDIGKLELSTDIAYLPYHELAHYCWLDANITLRITQFDDNLLLRLIILLMRISRLSMEDVTRLGISSWIQSLFRQEHRSRNILIPQPEEIRTLKASDPHTEAMIKDKAFKGAIVIEPVAGVHFNATVLDFASLYPTIMKRHNISYETVDCPHEECRNADDNRVPETDHWICKKNRGMISQTIGFFRDTRVKWFKGKSKDTSIDEKTRNWYTVVEKALKVFVNASYGVTGAQHFELFCMPAAESVTAYGRNAIVRTKEKAESMGIRVLYGDTDSVFLDNPSMEQQQELVKWSSKFLGIDLEVEKTYKYVALSDRKKNYIGVYQSGYVEVKGLSGKKRNTPLFIQKAFNEMLEALAKVDSPDGFDTAREEIREIINRVIDRLEGKAEEYTPEELAYRVQLTKTLSQYGDVKPQHVRAAHMLEDAGHDVQAGMLVEYIKTKGRDDILPVPMAKETSYWIDKDKYIDTLRSVFEQVLESIGLDFESLLGFTTLEEFF